MEMYGGGGGGAATADPHPSTYGSWGREGSQQVF